MADHRAPADGAGAAQIVRQAARTPLQSSRAGPSRCRHGASPAASRASPRSRSHSAIWPGSLSTGTSRCAANSAAEPGGAPLNTAISDRPRQAARRAIPSSRVATKNRRQPAAASARRDRHGTEAIGVGLDHRGAARRGDESATAAANWRRCRRGRFRGRRRRTRLGRWPSARLHHPSADGKRICLTARPDRPCRGS